MDLEQIETKYIWTGLGIFTLLLFMFLISYHNKFSASPASHKTTVTRVSMADPQISQLGNLEGPYSFSQVVGPTRVQLVNLKTKSVEEFRLFGLSESVDPNPTPTPSPAQAAAPAENTDARKAQAAAVNNLKMEGLKGLFTKNDLWVARMSDQNPPQAYLFQSDRQGSPDKRPTGQATLINAQALRQGMAIMDLTLPGIMNQPFSDIMLDCQLAGYLEAQSHKTKGNDLWTKFNLTLPNNNPIIDARLPEVRNNM